MRNIEVKENGSMWQLATFWGREQLPNEGCGLLWKSLWHLCIVAFLTALVGAGLGDLVATTVASFVMGTFIWGPANIVLGLILSVVLFVFLITLPIAICAGADEDSKNPVMKTIYNIKTIKQGFKEKWCPLVVEIEEEK